jgi:hypothetical protein
MGSNDDLIQNVYAYFLDKYRQAVPGASGGELVAFEHIGFSPGCSNLTGTNVAAAALEELAYLVDVLPLVDGGFYSRTMRTISVTYSMMLDAAEPSSAASSQGFSDLKTQAKKAYDAAEAGSFDGPTSYKPTYPTPIDWYDLTNTANWASYCYTASAQAPPVPAGQPTPPVAPNVHLQWHIVPPELRPAILRRSIEEGPEIPERVERPMFISAPAVQVERQAIATPVARPAAEAMVTPVARPAVETMATAVVRPAGASVLVTPKTLIHPVELTALMSVANIATQTAPQPVETPKFSMSFDYCLVRLRRSWLSGDFLATPGWYVNGKHAGDYASGGSTNTGDFPVIPTAFIAVKNLVIDAAWSDSDAAAGESAASFGPFSLLGRPANDKNGIHNPGLQIIAWICTVLPQLPPDNAPSLPAAAAPPPATAPGTS